MSERYDSSQATRDLFGRLIEEKQADLDFYRGLSDSGLVKAPFYHQAKRIRAAMNHGRVLLADDTGTGKTYAAAITKFLLDHEEGRKHRTLVTCPKSAMVAPWNEEEIGGYSNGSVPRIHYINGPKDLRHLDGDNDFVVVNYEKWAQARYADALTTEQWDLMVFDECHKMKNPKSKRAGWNERRGLTRLLENYGNRLILMSATPIANRLNDMGMILYALDPQSCPDPTAYDYERQPFLIWQVLNRHKFFRITKEDLKDQLGLPPVPEEQVIPVSLSEPEIDAYVSAWEQSIVLGRKLADLRKAMLDYRLIGGTEEPSKYRILDSMLEEKMRRGEQAVIFTGLKEGVTDELEQRYSIYNAVMVDGDTNKRQRERAISAFRNEQARVFIGTTGTMAEAISLATGDTPCSVIRLEPPFALSDWVQTVGRVYRKGQRAPVEAYTFVAECDDRLWGKMENAFERILREYEMMVR